ncbi:MAG: hypothetical protein D3919_11535 [Candidatus Electrothrix sp. AW5]|nr:hypothetical protein [Candidatus Electrothrix gigas]
MIFFKVMISGTGLQLIEQDESTIDVGFVKNEYVLAKSAKKASMVALSNVEKNISEQVRDKKIIIKNLELTVDETESSFSFWKLLLKEGIIFFPEAR